MGQNRLPSSEEALFKSATIPGSAPTDMINDFIFDGRPRPTFITASFVFDNIFAAVDKKREGYIEFVSCSPF